MQCHVETEKRQKSTAGITLLFKMSLYDVDSLALSGHIQTSLRRKLCMTLTLVTPCGSIKKTLLLTHPSYNGCDRERLR